MEYKSSAKMLQRKEARRRLILDAAIALFGDAGYHATTVPMIVAKAKSSTGAFYLYFRNKEDVYVAAINEIDSRLGEAIHEGSCQEITPRGRLGGAVEGFVRWLAANPGGARILMEAATISGRPAQARQTLVERHVSAVASALGQAVPQEGAAERGVLARCWVGAVLEAATGWLQDTSENRPSVARLAKLARDFNLRGAGIAPPADAP